MIKILIIDKEQDTIHQILEGWKEYNCKCKIALNINDGVEKFLSFHPDIILTEYTFHNSSVKDLVKRIRKLADIPIIVFSSRTDEAAILTSFQYGADDFIKKHGCSSKELFFRLLKILKNFRNRPLNLTNDMITPNAIILDDIIVNKSTNEVKKANQFVFLSPTEYKLLLLLACQKNNVVKISTIMATLFPNKNEDQVKQTLYTYFSNIRKKLSLTTTSSVQIKCISSEGYCLIVN